jgi:hypothetical protein
MHEPACSPWPTACCRPVGRGPPQVQRSLVPAQPAPLERGRAPCLAPKHRCKAAASAPLLLFLLMCMAPAAAHGGHHLKADDALPGCGNQATQQT